MDAKKQVIKFILEVMDKFDIRVVDLEAVMRELLFENIMKPDDDEAAWLKKQKLGSKFRKQYEKTRKT